MYIRPTTRRALTRAVFLIGCALPTLAVTIWIAFRSTVDYSRLIAGRISDTLGVVASIDDVEFQSPRVTTLHRLSLHLPGVTEPLLKVESLTVTRHGSDADRWTGLRLENATVSEAEWRRATSLVENLLRRQLLPESTDWYVMDGSQLRITDSAGRSVSLQSIDAGLTGNATESQAWLRFLMNDADAKTKKAVLHAQFNAADSNDTTEWRFESNGNETPGTLFAPRAGQPMSNALASATLDGRLTWHSTSNGPELKNIAGVIRNVDLTDLVDRPFPPLELSGKATINLKHCILSRGQLLKAAGELAVDNGMISPDMVSAAVEHLGLRPTLNTNATVDSSLSFDKLRLGFEVAESRVAIRGNCDFARPGVVLMGPQIELACELDHQVSAFAVAEMFAEPEAKRAAISSRNAPILRALLRSGDSAPRF